MVLNHSTHCYTTITIIHCRTFSSSQTKTSYPLNSNSPFSPPSTPGNYHFTASMNLTTLGTSYKGDLLQYLSFCVWLTYWHNVFRVYTWCRIYQEPLSVGNDNSTVGIQNSLIVHSFVDRHLGCFLPSASVTNVTMNTGVGYKPNYALSH